MVPLSLVLWYGGMFLNVSGDSFIRVLHIVRVLYPRFVYANRYPYDCYKNDSCFVLSKILVKASLSL